MLDHSAKAIDFRDAFMEDAELALKSGFPTFEQWIYLQKEWSISAFGPRSERGPIGPLRHLEKEAVEAVEAAQKCVAARDALFAVTTKEGKEACRLNLRQALEELLEEIVDEIFLAFDAAWRAGFGPSAIRHMLARKLQKNRARKWPKVTSEAPVEHDRSGE